MTLLLAAASLLLALPTLVRLVGDHGQRPLVVLAVLVPVAVVPLVVLALVQLLTRRRRLAAATVVVLALDALWLVPFYVADRVQLGERLNVMTVNLRFGEADPSDLVSMVRRHRVDVLATVELTAEAVARLRAAGLDRELPYAQLAPFRAADGSGLWSRYPLDQLPPFDLRFQAPGALVKMPSRQVVVRVVHAFPPTDGALYRRDYAALRRQVRRLDPTMPTVLAGDFNASTDNSELRRLMGDRFRDAAEQSGSGLHGTWSFRGWPLLLQLDHILVDGHLQVRSTDVLEVNGSDHRAVLARLVVE